MNDSIPYYFANGSCYTLSNRNFPIEIEAVKDDVDGNLKSHASRGPKKVVKNQIYTCKRSMTNLYGLWLLIDIEGNGAEYSFDPKSFRLVSYMGLDGKMSVK